MAPRFEDLIERHHDEIFAYLWRLLGKQQQCDIGLEVEDLTQDVFMRAYENYSALRRDSNYRAWLYKIATNCAFTKLRQAKRRQAKHIVLKIEKDKADTLEEQSSVAELRALVEELPAKQKACLTMRYLQDLDYSEIASSLDCSEQSARANVSQAIRRLRAALPEELK